MGDLQKASVDKKSSKKKAKKEQNNTTKNWMPIQNIVDGVIILKNGMYVKIIEVIPVNFKLKSREDKRFIIINYRAFLKACRFPMHISIQCKKADVDPHIKRVREFLKIERNENVKKMLHGYIKLINSLAIGTKGAVSRRFFMIIPYTLPFGVKEANFQDVVKQLSERQALVKEFISKCGNEIVDHNNSEFVANVLYTYLNKKTCEVQRFGGKMLSLSGLFVNSDLDAEGEDEE